MLYILLAGWHLLPAIAVDGSKPVSWLTKDLDATDVLVYDTTTSAFTSAPDIQPGQAYFVNLRTSSLFTPPLPREVTTHFVYDGDGGRVKQTTASGTTTSIGIVR